MAQELFLDQKVIVTVAGSSANLGLGFDTPGLAVALYDIVEVEVIESGVAVEIHGKGEVDLPCNESNPVVRAIRAGLRAAGVETPGLKITRHNTIPQSCSLGFSAAAIVAGVVAVNGLAGFPLTDDQVVQGSSASEGHPDDAGASIPGRAVASWIDKPVDGRTAPQYRAVSVPVRESIQAIAFAPVFHAFTNAACQVLPSDVSHVDARLNVPRTAVMTAALQFHPGLLWGGTRDRLYRPYRSDVLLVTAEWVNRLHNRDYAAFLLDVGPTCMILGTIIVDEKISDDAREAGIKVMELGIGEPVKAVVDG